MKLGTRLIIFSSVFLILLPWFAYHFTVKVEQSLLQGQQEAQSMVASAIATVLNGHSDLFDVDENALYVYPIEQNISVDGYDEDWQQLKEQFSLYADDVFSLLLSNGALPENKKYLFAYLRVKDKDVVYRHPRYRLLDTSDHIRLEFIDKNNQHRRFVLLTEAQGSVSVYEVDSSWQNWINGKHVTAILAYWRETSSGYDIELQLPIDWLETNRRLSISIVNVFNENERSIESIVTTQPLKKDDPEDFQLNPLLFQSSEISKVIKNLSESDLRICVIDKYRRIRAVLGGDKNQTSLCQAIDKVEEALVIKALSGESQVAKIKKDNDAIIVSSHPVFNGEDIVGAVLISKNSQQILSSQRDTFKDILVVTAVLFVIFFVSLLLFSSWLAFRINRLKKQTASLIDDNGRFTQNIDLSDSMHGDEIGALSRSFSLLLVKLNRYTCFLESVPRMLRHEILNPVNTISMSMQNIKRVGSNDVSTDVAAACSAIEQLQLIVSSLTEAASIDEALKQDMAESFDIAALLSEYVENIQNKHPDSRLVFRGVKNNVFVCGSDMRIVQLLDKIKDNALDFAFSATDIIFQLEVNQFQQVLIQVKNEGDFITQDRLDIMFQGMVSHRTDNSLEPHMGIGLYVANQIADFHHGRLEIANRRDKQGVQVVLILPVIETET